MCGISGIYSFNNNVDSYYNFVLQSLNAIRNRGPEVQLAEIRGKTVLGHARLAILDTSVSGNQPFSDESGRYTIVYNGEFFNYKTYYKELKNDGIQFLSTTDTEVLLYLYIKYGKSCLDKINGFFAFAIYDSKEETLFIARDRMGVKPLYFIQTTNFFGFSSELKGLMEFPFERNLNYSALYAYLMLNYIPAPITILNDVEKLEPGTMLTISNKSIKKEKYYNIVKSTRETKLSYSEAQKILVKQLYESVNKRLISDVPLGTFLSGGIDSSIISTIASKSVDSLQTFSIGFKDNPYIDETKYARNIAKKIHSQHTEIQIDNKTLEESLFSILNGIDEPFADSSSIAVHVLCKYVKPYITVALSGDGADELFAGYNKHLAHYNHLSNKTLNSFISFFNPIIERLPQSRSNALFNTFRKINKYADCAKLPLSEVYWKWCCFTPESQVKMELQNKDIEIEDLKSLYLSDFSSQSDLNDVLYTDQRLVLPNDMLTKVDRMSMDNSLEVRTPFLDYSVVEFVNSLPVEYKIDQHMKKKILQDAFSNELPEELYNRPKKGFEVPLQSWCKTILQDLEYSLLSEKFIKEQGIFDYNVISRVVKQSQSSSSHDAPYHVWALLVFQSWWKRYLA